MDVEGVATRSGVFEYGPGEGGNPGPGVLRELRHPDDVFDPASMASLRGVPFTADLGPLGLDHPPPLDAANTREYIAGVVMDVRREGELVIVRIRIFDERAVQLVESGKNELSCGYSSKSVDGPFVYNGVEAHARQTEILYNHLALVERGRASEALPAGPPSTISDRVQRTDKITREDMFVNVKINGKTYRLDSKTAKHWEALCKSQHRDQMKGEVGQVEIAGVGYNVPLAVAEMFTAMSEKLSEVLAENEELRAQSAPETAEPQVPQVTPTETPPMSEDADPNEEEKADRAKIDVKKLRDSIVQEVRAELADKIRGRADLERKASAVLGLDYSFGDKSDAAIMADVVAKVTPDRSDSVAPIAGATAPSLLQIGRLSAWFDDAIEEHRKRSDSSFQVLGAVFGDGKPKTSGSTREDAKKRYHARLNQSAGTDAA
jgi:hypothetical protein